MEKTAWTLLHSAKAVPEGSGTNGMGNSIAYRITDNSRQRTLAVCAHMDTVWLHVADGTERPKGPTGALSFSAGMPSANQLQ